MAREDVYQVRDAEQQRKYYSQIPHLISDMGLSTFAVTLYLRFKRVAGDHGECYQGVRKLAEDCQMSRTSVIKARKELEERKLISVSKEKNKNGGYDMINVTIIDIWNENVEIYEQMAKDKRNSGHYVDEATKNQVPNMERARPLSDPRSFHKKAARVPGMDLKNIEEQKNNTCAKGAGEQPSRKEEDAPLEKPREESKAQPSRPDNKGSDDPLSFLPPMLRPLGEVFLEEGGHALAPMDKDDRKLWMRTLNAWYTKKIDAQAIREAISKMRSHRPEPLIISGPQSVTKVARSCLALRETSNNKSNVFQPGDYLE